LEHTVYKEKHLRLEARRKRLVIHGCWSMNIGTVLIEHDYNSSPLKGTQTFSVGRPLDAQRKKRSIGIKKKKKESKGIWTKNEWKEKCKTKITCG